MNTSEMDVLKALHTLAISNVPGINKSYIEEIFNDVVINFKAENRAYLELCEELHELTNGSK